MGGLQFRVFLFISWLCRFHFVCANAQSTTEPATTSYVSPRTNMNPSLSLMIVAFIFAVACMGSLMLSLRYCSGPHAGTGNGLSTFKPDTHGVDPAVIDSFPILVYSTIKEHKIGKGALECAVCLCEFQDCETLRLLPKCAHVFHPGCVDAWLTFHVTCPVCRANLTEKYRDFCGSGTTLVENIRPTPDTNFNSDPDCLNVARNGSVSNYGQVEQHQQAVISVNPDESSNVGSRVIAHTARNASADALQQNRQPEKPEMFTKFPRSHSTGHSLVQPAQSMERYTLRLPEEVRKQLMDNHMKLLRSSSFDSVPFRVGSSRKGCIRCGVEGSSSRGSERAYLKSAGIWFDGPSVIVHDATGSFRRIAIPLNQPQQAKTWMTEPDDVWQDAIV